MYIALSDSLLKEFLSYKGTSNFDKVLISNLFKYLQPFRIGRYQLATIQDQSLAKQLLSGNSFISTSPATTEEELIEDTHFKLMLTDSNNNYPYVNINNDELDINFNATYKKGKSRDKAINHIKALIKDSRKVHILDKFFFKNSSSNFKFFFDASNRSILKDNVNFKIYADLNLITGIMESFVNTELNKIATNHELKNYQDNKMHDRYIELDNITIILSSGFDYLQNSTKDLTYIIKKK